MACYLTDQQLLNSSGISSGIFFRFLPVSNWFWYFFAMATNNKMNAHHSVIKGGFFNLSYIYIYIYLYLIIYLSWDFWSFWIGIWGWRGAAAPRTPRRRGAYAPRTPHWRLRRVIVLIMFSGNGQKMVETEVWWHETDSVLSEKADFDVENGVW